MTIKHHREFEKISKAFEEVYIQEGNAGNKVHLTQKQLKAIVKVTEEVRNKLIGTKVRKAQL